MAQLTWTGEANNGNPNDPKNWQPQQSATKNDAVTFPWGKAQIEPGYTWSVASVTVTGGAQVAFASSPYVSGSMTVESGGSAFITAPSGTFDAANIVVNGGATFISAIYVDTVSLSVTSGSKFTAQNGLDVTTTVTVYGGSTGDAYGIVNVGGDIDVQLGSEWLICARQNCYARGTRIRMYGGVDRPIETIIAGDVLAGGHIVHWVGRSNRPAKFVDYKGLIVTEDHLIYHEGFLYPAKIMPGAVPSDYAGDYFHVQCERHIPVTANGVLSESFLDIDGYDDLQTVSGERLNKRFTRSGAYAKIAGG